nr:reverse transcriptase domain-containing protein [Tanacetum cinerariifolium]
MLKRMDDYLLSEEAFRNTELPKVKSSGERRKAKRKRGQRNSGPQKGKVINMVQCHSYDQKRQPTMTDVKWMNVPITFPPILARDISEEALVVEAEVEGHLIRRVHIDEGASFEIMFEHCFYLLLVTPR